jgi:hypothetical protein
MQDVEKHVTVGRCGDAIRSLAAQPADDACRQKHEDYRDGDATR